MLPAPAAPPPPPDLVLVAAAAPVVVFRCFTVPPAPLFPAGDRLPAPTDVADAGTGIFFSSSFSFYLSRVSYEL